MEESAIFKTNEQEYRLGTCSNPFEEIITRYAIKSDQERTLDICMDTAYTLLMFH